MVDRRCKDSLPRTETDDSQPTIPYNADAKGHVIRLPSGIQRSSKCGIACRAKGKALPSALYKQNFAASALLHVSGRLIRYFKAQPIKVITDQPIKQILNKAEASGKLAKYYVELGAYDITYESHSAIKGQVLADFINEVLVGHDTLVPGILHIR
ncbi:hypothetical protein Tco_1240974 [Tanacetum coccineum]